MGTPGLEWCCYLLYHLPKVVIKKTAVIGYRIGEYGNVEGVNCNLQIFSHIFIGIPGCTFKVVVYKL